MEKYTLCWATWSLIFMFNTSVFAQELETAWKFETSSRILASPVETDGTIYIGDTEGVFYAVDASSGKEMWKLETKGNIQAKALVVEGNVFFESANVFYLVKGSNGKELWKFDTGMEPHSFTYQEKKYNYKIDPFDDKRSVATLVDGTIYIGSGNGKLYGLDAKTGKIELSLNSDENSPIRSSPLVNNGLLFFGDWNGVVYSYDLEKKVYIWKKKTYRQKLYNTFGGVVSEFLEYDSLLFFGARNHMMNVLDVRTGEKEWTYTDAKGGWMIGDPVIFRDTLYIGGSDNFSMYAFQPNMGRPLWNQNGKKNIYTKPILTEKWLIYTAGNGYNWSDTGKLFLLNRTNGEVIHSVELPNGVFSSPILIDKKVFFGCYDGNLYCVRIKD